MPKKIKITTNDLDEYVKATEIVRKYREMNLKNVDFSKFFIKPLKKEHIEHLETATRGGREPWPTSILLVADMWAKEFNNQLTPEFDQYVDKFRVKRKN